MKDEMYTYHYFKHRSIIKPAKAPDLIFQATVLFGLAYLTITLVVLFR